MGSCTTTATPELSDKLTALTCPPWCSAIGDIGANLAALATQPDPDDEDAPPKPKPQSPPRTRAAPGSSPAGAAAKGATRAAVEEATPRSSAEVDALATDLGAALIGADRAQPLVPRRRGLRAQVLREHALTPLPLDLPDRKRRNPRQKVSRTPPDRL